MTNASSMHDAGHPKPVLWDNLDGWGGEGAGRRFRMREGNMYTYGWLLLMHGKNH